MTIPDLTGFTIGALASITAAALGATITWLTTNSRTRVQLLLDMHKEFTSISFCDIRARAHKVLCNHPNKDWHELEAAEDGYTLYAVIRFFQRLWLVMEHRQVPTKYVGQLFGEAFYLWYHEHFASRLVHLEWQSAKDIKALKDWFDKNTSHHTTELWTSRAKHDIFRARDIHPSIPLQMKPPNMALNQSAVIMQFCFSDLPAAPG